MCMWGLGVGLPEKIASMGGKFLFDDDKETPEVQTSLYHYPAQKKMIQFEVRHWCTNEEDGAAVGNIFYGSGRDDVVGGIEPVRKILRPRAAKRTGGEKRGDTFLHFIKTALPC